MATKIKYLGPTELAARLGRHRSTIYYRLRLLKLGDKRDLLPAPTGVNPVTLGPCWDEADVVRWIAKCYERYGLIP